MTMTVFDFILQFMDDHDPHASPKQPVPNLYIDYTTIFLQFSTRKSLIPPEKWSVPTLSQEGTWDEW